MCEVGEREGGRGGREGGGGGEGREGGEVSRYMYAPHSPPIITQGYRWSRGQEARLLLEGRGFDSDIDHCAQANPSSGGYNLQLTSYSNRKKVK